MGWDILKEHQGRVQWDGIEWCDGTDIYSCMPNWKVWKRLNETRTTVMELMVDIKVPGIGDFKDPWYTKMVRDMEIVSGYYYAAGLPGDYKQATGAFKGRLTA